ncbi:MAG: hypothetical protein SNG69_09325 [Rikenellaceae bacterium]
MLLLTVTEFRKNISKYLELALTERVAIRSKFGVFDIVHNPDIITSNPSPSGDPFWDVPENLAQLNEAIEEMKNTDHSQLKHYTSIEDLKKDLGLCDDK